MSCTKLLIWGGIDIAGCHLSGCIGLPFILSMHWCYADVTLLEKPNNKFTPKYRPRVPQKERIVEWQKTLFRCNLLVSGRVVFTKKVFIHILRLILRYFFGGGQETGCIFPWRQTDIRPAFILMTSQSSRLCKWISQALLWNLGSLQGTLFVEESYSARVNWWPGGVVVWIPGIPLWKGLGFLGVPSSNPKPPGPKPIIKHKLTYPTPKKTTGLRSPLKNCCLEIDSCPFGIAYFQGPLLLVAGRVLQKKTTHW